MPRPIFPSYKPRGIIPAGLSVYGPRQIFENTDKLTNRGTIANLRFPL